jgi:soluble lytic murein transglycosylase-like protein
MLISLMRKLSLAKSFLACLVLFNSSFVNADIYRSKSEDNVDKWSTQALDTSYTKTSISEDQPIIFSKPLNANSLKQNTIINRSRKNSLAMTSLYKEMTDISNKYNVDPDLVKALVAVESNFNTHVISPKGARGLMQLMPATAKRYGMKSEQDLHIPSKNIDMGVRHLKDLLKLHEGQVALAIASYNAGQGAVNKHGQRIPSYRETMLYVPAVLSYMARYSSDAQSAPNAASIAN